LSQITTVKFTLLEDCMMQAIDGDSERFIEDEKLTVKFKVGTSLLTQFIKNHDYLDCIIEAIQNDFDAHSAQISFSFSENELTIKGEGEIVDEAGWNRLTYSLGYNVASEGKIGTIGNKNQGVRSYLLFGDSIVFKSGGKKVLITPEGSSQEPKDDLSTKEKKGVAIIIPFRETNSTQGLPVFSIDQEQRLINNLVLRLPGIFSQLQIKGWENVLRRAIFTFVRSNVVIELVQETPMISECGEFTEYNRKIKLTVNPLDNNRLDSAQQKQETVLEQVEYVAAVPIPNELLTSNTPNFFLQEKEKGVTIGLSFILSQGQPVKQLGHLFYPLELINVKTGNSFNVNAPFVLDLSRQALVATDNLNKELINKAGELTGSLFRNVLIKKYGASSYKLLCQTTDTSTDFQTIVMDSVKKTKIIINEKFGTNTENIFCNENAYLPASIDLYGFLSNEEKVVSHLVEDEDVKRLFVELMEVEKFDIHDVVELWSNDYLSGTIVGWYHENNRDDFSNVFINIDNQLKYANAFVSHRNELKTEEVERLKKSSCILDSSKSGSNSEKLNSALNMCIMKNDYDNVPYLDLHRIVNSQISYNAFFTSVLMIPEVSLDHYVLKILAPKITSMSAQESISVLDFLLSNLAQLSRESIEALKETDIFRTNDDKWTTYNEIIDPSPEIRKAFGNALRYLHPSIDNDSFKKAFNFRKEPFDNEIERGVNRLVEMQNLSLEDVTIFEKFLKSRVLSLDLIQKIRDKVLTIDANNRICRICRSYQDTIKLRRLLGPMAHYIDFSDRNYYKQFDAHEVARFDDMLQYISEVKENGGSLTDVIEFYRELSYAKKRENNPRSVDQQEILFINDTFVCPANVFIYKKYEQRFFGSMNYWNQTLDFNTKIALLELGCKEYPGPREYLKVLKWVSGQVLQGKPLEKEWKTSAQWAYAQLPADGLPDGATVQERFLLTTKNIFTSLDNARTEMVYYNDSDELAAAMSTANPGISFFDCGQTGHSFFQNLPQIPKISEQVRWSKDTIEGELEPSIQIIELLERLHSREVINGIKCYIEQNQLLVKLKHDNCMEKIISLKKIKYAKRIFSTYTIDGFEQQINIPAGARIIEDILYVQSDLHLSELPLEISKTIAEEIVDARDAQSSITLAVNAFLTGLDVQKFLQLQKYSYQESIDVPPLETEANEKEPADELQQSDDDLSHNSTANVLNPQPIEEKERSPKDLSELVVGGKENAVQEPETSPVVEYHNSSYGNKSMEEQAKEFFSQKGSKAIDLSKTFRTGMEITGPLHSRPKLIVVGERKPIAGLNLEPVKVGTETLLVTPGMPVPEEEKVKEFLHLLQTIVVSIGGNPETVKIMVTWEATEARELLPSYPNQIGFNINLATRSPIFWVIIVAREFASLQYKQHYPHVKAMAAYIEKALHSIQKIDPTFFEAHTANEQS
jgi:hypothetical protein